jgi:hypothetical protein
MHPGVGGPPNTIVTANWSLACCRAMLGLDGHVLVCYCRDEQQMLCLLPWGFSPPMEVKRQWLLFRLYGDDISPPRAASLAQGCEVPVGGGDGPVLRVTLPCCVVKVHWTGATGAAAHSPAVHQHCLTKRFVAGCLGSVLPTYMPLPLVTVVWFANEPPLSGTVSWNSLPPASASWTASCACLAPAQLPSLHHLVGNRSVRK